MVNKLKDFSIKKKVKSKIKTGKSDNIRIYI